MGSRRQLSQTKKDDSPALTHGQLGLSENKDKLTKLFKDIKVQIYIFSPA